MKKLSTFFTTLAFLLTNIMCVVVTLTCANGYHAAKHHLTSAPWEVGLLLIIPFAIGILLCSLIALIAKKRANS